MIRGLPIKWNSLYFNRHLRHLTGPMMALRATDLCSVSGLSVGHQLCELVRVANLSKKRVIMKLWY